MSGAELLKILVAATGLPKESVQNEIEKSISLAGLNKDNITLTELRAVLANYMQDILVNAKKEYSE